MSSLYDENHTPFRLNLRSNGSTTQYYTTTETKGHLDTSSHNMNKRGHGVLKEVSTYPIYNRILNYFVFLEKNFPFQLKVSHVDTRRL